MKQSTIINAYKTINALSDKKYSISISHKLWTIKTALEPHFEFQMSKEREVFEKYQPEFTDDGNMKFKSKEEGEAFFKEYTETVKELSELDVDMSDFKKVILQGCDNIELSIDDIAALSEFVEFVE